MARAEPVRYMFELAGVEYEDNRVSQDQWKEIKATTGLGQLPVLEVDGKQLPQSAAIYRYVGRVHGFYPSDACECAKVDVVTETVSEFNPDLGKIFIESDQAKKADLIKTLSAEKFPKRFSILEKLLVKTNEGKQWFVGDKISLADVQVFCILHDLIPVVIGLGPGGLDLKDHPHLAAFLDRFKSEEKISQWIKKRPVTSF
ncbi:Protein CBR-GST-11 [Apostichopus japonicus]|uniref:Protein CBR-GST-11 n=1 Tax=Stichopus japonicus TaxID=307972 RepID=A0A2G8KE08_STIJA|nr:Protein CBR-GST-11 [Apostichopus japonicus]